MEVIQRHAASLGQSSAKRHCVISHSGCVISLKSPPSRLRPSPAQSKRHKAWRGLAPFLLHSRPCGLRQRPGAAQENLAPPPATQESAITSVNNNNPSGEPMFQQKNIKKLSLCATVALLCGAAQIATAHTGIKDSATEGKTLYTAFTIGHGCAAGESGTPLPVIAQSAVFPNAADSVAYKINPADGKDGEQIDLSTVMSGTVGHGSTAAPVGGLLGLSPAGIQDKSVFDSQMELTDEAGNVRGFQFTKGNLDTTLMGLIPFRVSGVSFVPDSCAKSVKVRIGIANYCTNSKKTSDDDRADLWIGHMTKKFNDPGVMPADFETAPYWPTMTINRDLAKNPLPASCGTGFDVAVQPSDTDIDKYLPIKGFWPDKSK
jgi:hypothetical protein